MKTFLIGFSPWLRRALADTYFQFVMWFVFLFLAVSNGYAQGAFDFGATAPVPGPNDISQLTSQAGSAPPGLNYYVNNGTPPGQTFTTGNNGPGYQLTNLYLQEQSGSAGGGQPDLTTYTLYIYQVSGTTATLLTAYISTNQLTFTQGDWIQWTGLSTLLQPNTTYGFALYDGNNGWWQLANTSASTYAGGQAALFPTSSGTLTFSSSSGYSAAFDLGLTPNSDPNATSTSITPSSVPVGGLAVIKASSGGTAPIFNQWLFTANGVTTKIPNATNITYVIQDVQTTNAGTYSLMVSNSMGIITNTPATLTVRPLAGAGVAILDYGTAAPVPGADDISQLLTSGESTGGNAQDGLNYYDNNAGSAPGQTFTTGSNPAGYIINGLYYQTAGLDGGNTATAQTYTLRLYSVSGSTGTLLSTYITDNSLGYPDGDWLLCSGGFTNVLQPNTVYAYTVHRNGAGYDLLAYDINNPHSGGQMAVITYPGAITFGNSGNGDATFDLALSPTPSVPVITQQPVNQTVVVDQPTSFSVGVLGGGVLSYQWYTSANTNYSDPVAITGATSGTYSIESPTLNNATNYFVVINPGAFSATSAVATLTVRVSLNSLAWLGTSSFSWDSVTPNWSNTVTEAAGSVYETGDNVQFTDAGKDSSPINLTTALSPTSVTVSSSNNYIFAGSGSLAGNVQLTKNDTGTLTISNANSFSGSVAINNGILQLANANALGTATNSVTGAGGTLDLNGVQAPASLQYNIEGNGYTNLGAINNSSTVNVQNGNGILGVNLVGDAAIGAVGRWDLYGTAGGAGLQGNNHNLTKVGTGTVFFIDAGANNQLANITVVGGTLGFQGTNNLGNPNDTLTVLGSSLAFYDVASSVNLEKDLVLSNAFFSNGGGDLILDAPISLAGTNTISAGYEEQDTTTVTFEQPITGAGGWLIDSIQNYVFSGVNTYSGPTIINSATLLTVNTGSSLGDSSLIQLDNVNATLDLSQPLTVGSGQTLAGIANNAAAGDYGGIYGEISCGAGSTLSPGVSGPGTLSLYNDLTLGNATLAVDLGSDPTQIGNGVNDLVSVGGNLTLTGVNTIAITPVGALSSSQPYTILTYGGSLTGSAANFQIVNGNPRYTISLVDPSTTPGSIQVSVSGVAASLIWKGGQSPNPNVWDHTVTNFFNTSTSTYDHFYDGDLVTFNDTALTNIIDLTQSVAPGSFTLANNTINYTILGGGNISGGLYQEGKGTVTLAISNTPALNYITNDQGTLAFDLPLNATLNTMISDNGGGLGTVMQAGTNILALAGNNSGYYGTFVVTNGVLQYTTNLALGSSTYLFATNGGSLDLNDVDTGTKNIAISGAGFNGQGALVDLTATWPPYPYQIAHNITLIGNATIGANARWDITGGTFAGNGYNLSKVGGSQVTFLNLGSIGVGNIDIIDGNLTFQGTNDLGDPTKTLTVESNASLGFWAGVSSYSKSNIVVINGTISSGGGANTLNGEVTLQPGTNDLATAADLYLSGSVVGTGGFTQSGGANLWLEGTNTYSGTTTIGGNSTTIVGSNSSLGSSSTVEIDGGSTLNLTAPASFNFGAGQTLVGNGTVLGNSINFQSGSTLSVGFSGSTYTLTMSGNLILHSGSTNIVDVDKTTAIANDEVSGLTSVTLGGTLVINNLGSELAGGDAIKLFAATNYSGSFSSIVPATPGSGATWDTSTLDTDGTLRVTAVAVPYIGTATVSGGNFVLTGSGGTPGTGYSVLSQTNVALPLSDWTVIGTGTFNDSGDFSFTNEVTSGAPNRFYLIRMP